MPDASAELKLPDHVPNELCPLEEFVRMNNNWLHQPRRDAELQRPTRGLKNLGNTCFMNATLQCLAGCPTLRAFILSDLSHTKTSERLLGRGAHHDSFITFEYSMSVMFCEPKPGHEHITLKPTGLKNQLNEVIKTYRSGAQEDAHEYAVNLLDHMHKMAVEVMKKKYHLSKALVQKQQNWQLSSSIYHIFGGKIRSQVVCAACGHQSNTYDPTVDLSLEIGGSNRCQSVEDCLSMFTHVETLGSSNEYSCEKCKQKTRATKQLTVHTLPNVLMLHLKRFDVMSTVYGGKISKTIRYGDTLDLGPYLSSSKAGAQDARYSLFGVLVHKGGGVRSGHYYSYVKAGGVWRQYDDETVQVVPEQRALNDEAYLLFYTRCSTRTEALHRNDDEHTSSSAQCFHHSPNMDTVQGVNHGFPNNRDQALHAPPKNPAPLPLPSSSPHTASAFCPMMPPGGIDSFRASLHQASVSHDAADRHVDPQPTRVANIGDFLGEFDGLRDLDSLDDGTAPDDVQVAREGRGLNGNGHPGVNVDDEWSQHPTQKRREDVKEERAEEAHHPTQGEGGTAGQDGGWREVRVQRECSELERKEVAQQPETVKKRKRDESEPKSMREMVLGMVGEGVWDTEVHCSSITDLIEATIADDVRAHVRLRLRLQYGEPNCRGEERQKFVQQMREECRDKYGKAVAQRSQSTLLKALDELSAKLIQQQQAQSR
mmetsp:Transcript_7302/g.17847  ORF Transcript_7302/g.17847 Transcript_7302/m.17847 type:complete len:710 (-) Transcript_7302:295-2424(-)